MEKQESMPKLKYKISLLIFFIFISNNIYADFDIGDGLKLIGGVLILILLFVTGTISITILLIKLIRKLVTVEHSPFFTIILFIYVIILISLVISALLFLLNAAFDLRLSDMDYPKLEMVFLICLSAGIVNTLIYAIKKVIEKIY